jgi:hypothetical protein
MGGVVSEPEDTIEDGADVEVVDGLPVLAEVHELEPREHGSLAAMQAAALTAGGFFAGALAMALAKRIVGRRVEDLATLREPSPVWPVGATRTYVVNVRLISRSSD